MIRKPERQNFYCKLYAVLVAVIFAIHNSVLLTNKMDLLKR